MMKTVRLLFTVLVCLLGATAAVAETHFVDKAATGANNGTSWQNAWRSFGDISWQEVAAGDTIFVSGGAASKVYNEGLTVGKAGQSGSPIVIRVGQENGHNGVVIIDGQDTVEYGVLLQDYVTVDGEVNGQIHWVCRNLRWTGFKSTDADGIVLRYVEADSCGDGTAPGGFNHGIHLQGANGCEVAFAYIHHNHQDGYNAGGSVGDSFGNNKVHHCRILWNSDDGVACRSGHDIYDNVIGECWPQPGGGDGHPDGIQAQGNYTRVWNNEIYNCSTHCVFADPLNCGDARNIRIWNNLLYRTRGTMHSHAIKVKQENGTNSISHILIANNTIADFG
ncbi:MAG: hypothetical protein FJ125_17680, partial [Deltaproteobacteria bacterium]|nr:hypothetical protein [Deltaproteobacteria bacterium]